MRWKTVRTYGKILATPLMLTGGLRRFRYLSSSLLSSSLPVPYRITEFATYHNRVRYLYLDAKFKTCRGEVVGAITWHNCV